MLKIRNGHDFDQCLFLESGKDKAQILCVSMKMTASTGANPLSVCKSVQEKLQPIIDELQVHSVTEMGKGPSMISGKGQSY